MKKEDKKEIETEDEKYKKVKEDVMTSEVSIDELLKQLDVEKDD